MPETEGRDETRGVAHQMGDLRAAGDSGIRVAGSADSAI
jgi:hypothetical protein